MLCSRFSDRFDQRYVEFLSVHCSYSFCSALNALPQNNLKDEGACSYRLYLSLAFDNLNLFFLMCFAP